MKWPKQQAPAMSTFTIWKSTITNIFNIDNKNRIRRKLGQWVKNPIKYVNSKFWTTNSGERLYSRDDIDGWNQYTRADYRRGNNYFYHEVTEVETELNERELIPVDCTINERFIYFNKRIIYQRRTQMVLEEEQGTIDMEETVGSYLKKESKKTPGTVKLKFIDEECLKEVEATNINICSDGGVKDKKGGFGFVIAVEDKVVMESNNRIAVTYNDPTSYRAEAVGVMCALQTYNRMQTFYRQRNQWRNIKRINFYCDNESVIKMIKQHRNRKLTSKTLYSADMDIFTTIFTLIQQIPDTISFYHVKGHQDRIQQPLSLPAYLNTLADNNATLSLQYNRLPKKESYNKATLFIDNLPVFANHSVNLKERYQGNKYKQYLKESFGWNDNVVKRIWWYPLEKSIEALHQGEKTTIHKFIHKRLPCNKRENIYYPYLSPYCKLCPNTIETPEHIMRCTSCDRRTELREKFMQQLKIEMRNMQTNETIIRVMTQNILEWLKGERPPNIREVCDDPSMTLIQAVSDQIQLGWDQFFCGRIYEKWGKMYEYEIATVENVDRSWNAEYWGKKLVALAHRFVLDAWKIRNDKEYHDEDPESDTSAKKKLIWKILWTITQIGDNAEHPYINEDTEKLNKLPMHNLEIMDDQVTSIWKVTKVRIGNEGG
jgi:hypothetical protein